LPLAASLGALASTFTERKNAMPAVIYQRPKSAMQSGRALTNRWMLEFEPAMAKKPDPLTGWAGSGDTRRQVRLSFPDCEAAKAYADNFR
jgi:hypothetical protein